MHERRAHRHTLLLSARQGTRERPGSVGKPDPLEELKRRGLVRGRIDTGQVELERNGLKAGQIRRERAGVVLIEDAERRCPVGVGLVLS